MAASSTKQPMTCTFQGAPITPSQSAFISISTFSRRIKLLNPPPSNVFFRTHQYDFRIKPNDRVYEIAGGDYGFFVRLRLMSAVTGKERVDEATGKPLVVVSFEEKPHQREAPWILRVSFLSSKLYRWISNHSAASETFYWKFDVYRQKDDDSFAFICSRCSNHFRLYSKPEVYLKQVEKGEVEGPQKEVAPGGKADASKTASRDSGDSAATGDGTISSSVTTSENSTTSSTVAKSSNNKKSSSKRKRKRKSSSSTQAESSKRKRLKKSTSKQSSSSDDKKGGTKSDRTAKTSPTDDTEASEKSQSHSSSTTAKKQAQQSAADKMPSPSRRKSSISSSIRRKSDNSKSRSSYSSSGNNIFTPPSQGKTLRSSFVEKEPDTGTNAFGDSLQSSGDFLSSLLTTKANCSLPTPPNLPTPTPPSFLTPSKSQKDGTTQGAQTAVSSPDLTGPNEPRSSFPGSLSSFLKTTQEREEQNVEETSSVY